MEQESVESVESIGTEDREDPPFRRSPRREPWDLAWQELELVLGERPLLDALHLQIKTPERASALLKGCGLNLNVPSQRRLSERLLGESMHFLRHVLMGEQERERFPLPERILECDDLRVLLVMASDLSPRKHYERLWACALLKIVHAVASLEFSGMLEDLPLARRQIFRRIKKHLKTKDTPSPCFLHPSGESIALAVVDWKEEKSRSSLILKLIHKSENLMDDVFDYIGVRFVVRDNHEIPLLLDALIRTDIVIPHLVIAPRSKNTLIDIGKGKKLLSLAKDLAGHGELTPEEYFESRRHVDWSPENSRGNSDRSNRFSSHQYRSLQLTVRHLVRLKNPAHRVLSAMSMQLENYQQGMRSNHFLETLVPEENVRFYPLEVQIMDLKSYEDSKFGPSSHEKYKANQLEAARRRILGPLFALNPAILASQMHKTIPSS